MQTSMGTNGKGIPSSADIAAELAAMDAAPADAPAPAASKAADPPADAAPAEGAADDDTPEDAPEAKPEPADDRGMASLRRQEERMRRAMAAERKAVDEAKAKLDAERKALDDERKSTPAELVEKARRLHALKERVKADPGDIEAIDAIADELGLGADDYEPWARTFFARSPAAKGDPKVRANAAALARQRAQTGRTSTLEQKYEALEKKYDDLEKKWGERESAAQAERAIAGYLDAAATIADTGKAMDIDDEGNEVAIAEVDAPIVKRWLKGDPKEARLELHRVAEELATRDKVVPEPHEVVLELEKRERKKLARRGLAVAGQSAPAAQSAATPPGRTLQKGGGGATAPKPKLSGQDLLDDIKRAVESGKLDD